MNQENNEELEINLSDLFISIKRNMKLIIISTLVCMIIASIATIFLISKKYESTARVLPKPEVTNGLVDNSQITANNSMVNNYVELIKGSTVIDQVTKDLQLEDGYVGSVLSVTNETNTQIITVSAKTNDPELSKKIVDKTISVFYKEIRETLKISNVATVDTAKVATDPVSPSLKINLLIGAALGIFMSCGYTFIKFMLDTRIHNKEEAEKYLGLPVIGVIPDMDS